MPLSDHRSRSQLQADYARLAEQCRTLARGMPAWQLVNPPDGEFRAAMMAKRDVVSALEKAPAETPTVEAVAPAQPVEAVAANPVYCSSESAQATTATAQTVSHTNRRGRR